MYIMTCPLPFCDSLKPCVSVVNVPLFLLDVARIKVLLLHKPSCLCIQVTQTILSEKERGGREREKEEGGGGRRRRGRRRRGKEGEGEEGGEKVSKDVRVSQKQQKREVGKEEEERGEKWARRRRER